jgi:hypothetical protein
MREYDGHHTSWFRASLTAEIIKTIHGWRFPGRSIKKFHSAQGEGLRTIGMSMRNQHGIDSS